MSFKNCSIHEWNGHVEIAVLNKWKILGNICFAERIFYRKQSLGAPVQRG